MSYDLLQDYLKFIVRSTYDSDLQLAQLFRRNIASYFTNTVSDDVTILQVNRTQEKALRFCTLDARRKSMATLAVS